MSLQIKACDACDQQVWNEYVSAHAYGHFMQSWEWGHFQEGQGWSPLRLLALRDGAPIGAMQILARKILGHGWLLYAPRGPVCDMKETDVLDMLVLSVREHFPFATSLRLDPYIKEDAVETGCSRFISHLPEEWSFWNAPKYIFWLDLSPGPDAVLKAMASGKRNEIRYPAKHGVTFVRGCADDAVDFHRLMVAMSQQKGIACHGLSYYQRLLNIFCGNNMGDLIFAEFEGSRIACGLSLRFGNKSWLLYAATDRQWHHLRSSRALQWEMIKSAMEAGCNLYDFRGTATGRVPDSKDPGFGVYNFKKDFGPDFIYLAGYFDYVMHPWPYKFFRFAERKGLPIAYDIYRWTHEHVTRFLRVIN